MDSGAVGMQSLVQEPSEKPSLRKRSLVQGAWGLEIPHVERSREGSSRQKETICSKGQKGKEEPEPGQPEPECGSDERDVGTAELRVEPGGDTQVRAHRVRKYQGLRSWPGLTRSSTFRTLSARGLWKSRPGTPSQWAPVFWETIVWPVPKI